MSLRAVVADAVEAAFNAVGDLKISVVYTPPNTGDFNPATGVYATNTDTVTLDAIKVNTKENDRNRDSTRISDLTILVKAASLGGDPSSNGTFTISSKVYSILAWTSDPAGATYTIDLIGGS